MILFLAPIGSTLIVRRGSEPALTTLGTTDPNEDSDEKPSMSNLKRWSAIASIDETKSSRVGTLRQGVVKAAFQGMVLYWLFLCVEHVMHMASFRACAN